MAHIPAVGDAPDSWVTHDTSGFLIFAAFPDDSLAEDKVGAHVCCSPVEGFVELGSVACRASNSYSTQLGDDPSPSKCFSTCASMGMPFATLDPSRKLGSAGALKPSLCPSERLASYIPP